eukprot:gene21874-8509_t
MGNDGCKKRPQTTVAHPAYIQGTSAVSGEGIYEGLDWMSAQMKKK